jgi:hypothetical protein
MAEGIVYLVSCLCEDLMDWTFAPIDATQRASLKKRIKKLRQWIRLAISIHGFRNSYINCIIVSAYRNKRILVIKSGEWSGGSIAIPPNCPWSLQKVLEEVLPESKGRPKLRLVEGSGVTTGTTRKAQMKLRLVGRDGGI